MPWLLIKPDPIKTAPILVPESSGCFFSIQKSLQMPDASGMTQFAQGFGLDLPDPLASDIVHLPNFLQCPFVAIQQAKTHFKNLSFAFGEAGEHIPELFLEQAVTGHLGRILSALVFDEVSHAYVPIITDGRMQRNGLLSHFEQ